MQAVLSLRHKKNRAASAACSVCPSAAGQEYIMMDLSLGPEVLLSDEEMTEIKSERKVLHSGNCVDGVYGCSKCWNDANDGWGTMSECDYCHKRGYTRVSKALDEPCLYALCPECRAKQALEALVLYEEYHRHYDED